MAILLFFSIQFAFYNIGEVRYNLIGRSVPLDKYRELKNRNPGNFTRCFAVDGTETSHGACRTCSTFGFFLLHRHNYEFVALPLPGSMLQRLLVVEIGTFALLELICYFLEGVPVFVPVLVSINFYFIDILYFYF